MPYDADLADRVRSALRLMTGIGEKKLFGCLCFLRGGKMLVGVWKHSLIARIGVDLADEAMRMPHVKPMDITGKPMKGWVIVEAAGVADEVSVREWVQQALQFVSKPPKE